MLDRLSGHTYAVRHNPNCPSPFELRTIGDSGIVDDLPPGRTGNLVSYGPTLDVAAEEMMKLLDDHAARRRERTEDRDRAIRIETAERRVRGLVWA